MSFTFFIILTYLTLPVYPHEGKQHNITNISNNVTPDDHSAQSHHTTVTTHSNTSSLCRGQGITMYMDGFHSYGLDRSSPECINFLFPSWTIDTPAKFSSVVVGIATTSFALEGINAFNANIKLTHSSSKCTTFRHISLHTLQLFVSYVLMFMTMTYNIELFFAVCFGRAIGFTVFNRHNSLDAILADNKANIEKI